MPAAKPTTVAAYLDALPPDRRAVVSAVRDIILQHLPAGYVERINYGVIAYEIPLARYPVTYNGQPLTYLGLGAQKHHFGLYAMCLYGAAERADWLRDAFAKAGKRLHMGKSCIRFKRLDDFPPGVVARIAALATPEEYIAQYEKVKPPKKASAKAMAKSRAGATEPTQRTPRKR